MCPAINVVFSLVQFPPTWGGLLQLLDELGMNKLLKELQEAIYDPHSNTFS